MYQTQTLDARQELHQELRLATLIQQAAVMRLAEDKFSAMVREVEDSPLFRRLFERDHVIRRRRYPNTTLAMSLLFVSSPSMGDSISGSLSLEGRGIRERVKFPPGDR
jgi:hypothetical protein